MKKLLPLILSATLALPALAGHVPQPNREVLLRNISSSAHLILKARDAATSLRAGSSGRLYVDRFTELEIGGENGPLFADLLDAMADKKEAELKEDMARLNDMEGQ